MSQTDREVAHLIQMIADPTKGKRHTIMSGKVVKGSVDETEGICSVELSVDSAKMPTEGVLLSAVTLNATGVLLYPADGSDVWVGEIDGPGKWGVLKCSKLVKVGVVVGASSVEVTDGLIKMNGGKLDGLPIVGKIAERMRLIENMINQLHRIYTLWTPVSNDGGLALKSLLTSNWATELDLTVQDDIENKKITQ